eukprot:1474828-Pleurochrysis_carterae.AAC.2
MPPVTTPVPNVDPPTAPQSANDNADIDDDDAAIATSPPNMEYDEFEPTQHDGEEGAIAERIKPPTPPQLSSRRTCSTNQ